MFIVLQSPQVISMYSQGLQTTDLERGGGKMTASFLVVCDECSGKHNTVQTKTRKHQQRAGAVNSHVGMGMSPAQQQTCPTWLPWQRHCIGSPGKEKSGRCHAFVKLLRKLAHGCLADCPRAS